MHNAGRADIRILVITLGLALGVGSLAAVAGWVLWRSGALPWQEPALLASVQLAPSPTVTAPTVIPLTVQPSATPALDNVATRAKGFTVLVATAAGSFGSGVSLG
ncbi:MAG TPA: hypothetical protein VFB73_15580 [Chloroflexota bacterium]|nr:hypothetical protein [Chloroflexota bacterium]HZU07384.1 hypothetical protein [Chloroflexota bacterium]